MKCSFKQFMSFFPSCLTKLVFGIILLVIVVVSFHQIAFGSKFHNSVIEAAKEEARRQGVNEVCDSSTCALIDSSICAFDTVKKEYVSVKSVVQELSSNNNALSSSQQTSTFREDSLLDILSKSDGLLSSNALTFCVTLIVTLLATLLLFRIDKMDQLVEQNKRLVDKNNKLQKTIRDAIKELKGTMNKSNELQNEVQEHTISYSKFANILTRIVSTYNMTTIISNMTLTLIQAKTKKEKDEISKIIASLCSRLSLLCSDIKDRLNNPDTKLSYLTQDEKAIVKMYLEDILDDLKRSLVTVNNIKNSDLASIIGNNIYDVEEIEGIIDLINIKNYSTSEKESS